MLENALLIYNNVLIMYRVSNERFYYVSKKTLVCNNGRKSHNQLWTML